MRSGNIFSIDTAVSEARYIIIEHQTPEVLWQPVLTTHANGAVGFAEIAFCTSDSGHLEAKRTILARPGAGKRTGATRGVGAVATAVATAYTWLLLSGKALMA